MSKQDLNREIFVEKVIPAGIDKVWEAWTTEEGVKTFFAPGCNIDIFPGGPYELFFNLDAEPGKQGSEGVTGIMPTDYNFYKKGRHVE